MRQRVFSALGIQTEPFAATGTPFVLKNLQLFHIHTGEPILITPEGQLSEREFFQLQNWMMQRIFSALGIQTGPLAA